jgi:Tol biopolymer transport system component
MRATTTRGAAMAAAVLGTALTAVLTLPATADGAIAFSRATGPLDRMYLAGDDGRAVRMLGARGVDPVISPDGTRIAHAAAGAAGGGPLRVLTLATGAVTTSTRVCRTRPVWSPDSTRLACVTERADRRGYVTGQGLALVEAATGASTTLVPAAGRAVDGVDWSPAGTRIAYTDGRYGRARTDLWVADPDDMARARRIMPWASGPVWGPVRIAAARTSTRRVRVAGRSTTEVRSQIWTVNPGGGGGRALTRFRTRTPLVTGPAPSLWTPAGRRVVGVLGGTDLAQVVVVDARSGALRRIGRPGEGYAVPEAVSPDGRTLLVSEGGVGAGTTRLRLMGVAGTPGRVLLRGVRTVSVSDGWRP